MAELYEIILRRRNGRFVKYLGRNLSKYRAKKVQDVAEEKYDNSFYIEVRKAQKI